MKKLSKILITVLAIATLVCAFVLTASAEDDSYMYNADNKAFALYADEAAFKADLELNKSITNEEDKYPNAIGRYAYLGDALSAMSSTKKYLALVADWELGEKGLPKGSSSFFLKTDGMTLDLNGHTMSFSVYSGYTTSSGTRATAYQWLSLSNAKNVTIIGNGGAIEGVMSLIMNSQSNTLNLIGGNGGLTLRSIDGKQYSSAGVWSDYSTYSGSYMIKLGVDKWTAAGPVSPILNMSGEINFERQSAKNTSAIKYSGTTTINVGSADGDRTSISYTDTSGTAKAGTEQNSGGLFLVRTHTDMNSETTEPVAVYNDMAVCSHLNINNADINILSDKLFAAEYAFRVVGEDDIQYVSINNSSIYATDHLKDKDGNSISTGRINGLFWFDRSANVRLEATDSSFETIRNIRLIVNNYYSKYKSLPGYSLFKNCKIRCVDAKTPFCFLKNSGTVVFEDCHLDFGYRLVTDGGTAWAPYDITKSPTVLGGTWPSYAETLGGVGILVKEGCTIPLKAYASSEIIGSYKPVTDAANIGALIASNGANTVTTTGEYEFVEVYDATADGRVRMVTNDQHLASFVHTVEWYDDNGNLLDATAVKRGETLTLPELEMTAATNGWYKTRYKWVDLDGNDVTESTVVNDDMCITKTVETYIPYVTVASYSLKLMTNIEFEFYIPTDKIIDGISNIRCGDIPGVVKVIDGVEYVKITTGVSSGSIEFDAVKSVGISYDYTDELGVVHPMTCTFGASVNSYVSYVIDNSESYEEEMILVSDLLQYHVELYKQLYPTEDVSATRFYQLFSQVEEYSSIIDSIIFDAKDGLNAYENLASVIDEISFIAEGYASGFQLIIKDSAASGIKVNDVQFVVRGYLPEADFENRINAGNVVYGIRTEDGQFSKNADGSYTMVRSARIPIYNITASEFTILVSVTDSQGNEQNLSGTYSYDAYCESVLEKYSEHTIIPFLKAVKAYSLSAGDYRFGGRKYFPEGVESVTGSEIKITKTSDNTVAKTVYPGETLTYTITVKNNASKACDVVIKDIIPDNTVYLEGADGYAEGAITWNPITLAAGEERTVSYTVKVNDDNALRGTVINGTVARANNARCFAKQLYVEQTINELDTEYIDIAISALMDSSFEDFKLVSWIYYVAYSSGVIANAIGTSTTPSELIEKVAAGTADEKVLDMVAPTLFGGADMPEEIIGVKGTSAGSVSKNDLVAGDILLVKKGDITSLYIYGTRGLYLVGAGCEKADTDAVLASLSESDKYAALRPSIRMTVFTPTPLDTVPEALTEAQRAVIETAKAYVLRGQFLQYDDTSMASGGYTRAQTTLRAPEDYNRNEWGYLNCAYFTFEAYYHSLNYNIGMDTTRALTLNSAGKGMQVMQWDNKRVSVENNLEYVYTPEEMEEATNNFVSCLEPGDLVVIVRDEVDGYGHVMLYIGNGNLIHSSGSNLVYANSAGVAEETYEPTIRYLRLHDYFLDAGTPNGYIFGDRVARLTVVRPLNKFTGSVPENTLNRINNLSGIKVQKYSTHNEAKTAGRGDSITYTFDILNTGDEAVTLNITDVVPANTVYVSGAQNKNGDNLSWTVTVPAEERITVSYTVVVSDVAEYGSYIDNSAATVGGVNVTCKNTKIERTFDADQEQAIINAVEELRSEGTTLTNLALVNEIYKRALGVEQAFADTGLETVTQGANGVFETNADGKFNLRIGSTYGEMLVPTLFGGRKFLERKTDAEKWTQTRLGHEHHLVVGDVLFGRTSSSYVLYMYVGSDKLLTLTNGLNTDSVYVEKRFERFLGYSNHYCVLRPSFIMDEIAD